VRSPSAAELLHDPELSFADFCTIANALAEGLSTEEILALPELEQLRAKLAQEDDGSDPAKA